MVQKWIFNKDSKIKAYFSNDDTERYDKPEKRTTISSKTVLTHPIAIVPHGIL